MKRRNYAEGGIYTAEMGQPPMDPEGGSVRPTPRAAAKKAAAKKAAKRAMQSIRTAGIESLNEAAEQATPMPGMKKGGSVSARADGIAKKGKTNCKMY